MSAAATFKATPSNNSVIRLPKGGFTDEQFFEFCLLNRDLRIERQSNGKIIIMSPTTSRTGQWNAKIVGELFIWNKKSKLGEVFDSSTGFTLPNHAVRSPDVSWISLHRWNGLEKSDQEKFAPICPDFVVELFSSSDSLRDLRKKMKEYIVNGCRMAWLVDPSKRQTMIYLPDGSIEGVPFKKVLSGGDVLPGFEILMEDIIPV